MWQKSGEMQIRLEPAVKELLKELHTYKELVRWVAPSREKISPAFLANAVLFEFLTKWKAKNYK